VTGGFDSSSGMELDPRWRRLRTPANGGLNGYLGPSRPCPRAIFFWPFW
jgi:hypothetical protein